MPTHISPARTDVGGLRDLGPPSCISTIARCLRTRRSEGASYLTASDGEGRLIGYALVTLESGADDTFAVEGGIAGVVSIVVTRGRRSAGGGRALLRAAEGVVRDHGFDTIKIAVMAGNARAQAFYEANGYSIAEHVLHRRIGTCGDRGDQRRR